MPTLIVFLFVFGMATLAYRMVFPVLAGGSMKRLALCDLGFMGVVFAVVGAHYYGTDARFDLILFEAGWAFTTFVAMVLSELVLLPGYLRRHGVTMDL